MSDLQLLERYVAGDVAAFEVLLQRYQKVVYNFVLHLTGHSADAEVIAGDVFLRVVDRAQAFRGEAKFTTWLYTIACNRSVDHVQQQVRSKKGRPANGGSPAAHAGLCALGRLALTWPHDEREVFLLRQIPELAFRDIAVVVGESEATVRQRMGRAMVRARSVAVPTPAGLPSAVPTVASGSEGVSQATEYPLELLDPPAEIVALVMHAAQRRVGPADAGGASAAGDEAEGTLWKRCLGWLGRVAMARQVAMSILMLLLVAVGLWYVPRSHREPRAAGGSVSKQELAHSRAAAAAASQEVLLSRPVEVDPPSPAVREADAEQDLAALHARARRLRRSGQCRAAVERYETLLARISNESSPKRQGKYAAAMLEVGLCYEQIGDIPRARHWLERASRVTALAPRARAALAQLPPSP